MGEARQRENDQPPLKSKKSVHYSFLRFLNKTNRNVDVVWVNYEGARVKYKTLTPEQFLDINTFAGHPWIFFDSLTGDKMVVQLKEIFEPVAWNSDGNDWPPQRKVVNITIPVYSLQECCLMKLRGIVPKDRINELEITDVLKEDLHKIMLRGGSDVIYQGASSSSSVT
ncbi:von Hippel-Lindau disease tumor suppressor-like [Ruditapes philippinarum]|uniref:von Hippel-Lindau disease tumor suppressor-like n=1 Tax=Ruditapes philippinarum TaxID=129788 RepID=UPI00295ACA9F|nr:von Hippel-Lindau disease tumor suppressor-like [Ruditapes philippinarum]